MTNVTIRVDPEIKSEAEALFNSLGISMSGAVNIFLRQAIREQAIPFPIRTKTAEEKYNEYFTPPVINSIKESAVKFERGEYITFTLDELLAMEDGNIPQRAIDFLESRKKAGE